jgi:hypothetical protein
MLLQIHLLPMTLCGQIHIVAMNWDKNPKHYCRNQGKSWLNFKQLKSHLFFRIFEYFGDKSSEFGVVFMANATASLKLLAETFNSTNNAEEYTGRRELSNDLNKLTG